MSKTEKIDLGSVSDNISEISTGSEHGAGTDEGIILSRTDAKEHDLKHVFNSSRFTEIVDNLKNTSGKSNTDSKQVSHINNEKSNSGSDSDDDEENDRWGDRVISIERSDGAAHDIVQVLRKNSIDDNLPLETILSEKRLSNISPVVFPTSIRIVHMSDTHNLLFHDRKNTFLPDGDILVHTGDFSVEGTEAEYQQFNAWLGSISQKYMFRVVIVGRKDTKILGNSWNEIEKRLSNATHVLSHKEATILGIRFYVCIFFPFHSIYN